MSLVTAATQWALVPPADWSTEAHALCIVSSMVAFWAMLSFLQRMECRESEPSAKQEPLKNWPSKTRLPKRGDCRFCPEDSGGHTSDEEETGSWFSCCTGPIMIASTAKQHRHRERRLQEHETHPKWTGLRLRHPGDPTPTSTRFTPGYLDDDSIYGGLEALDCSRDEREGCKALKAAVSSVDGPKDAITMLRYLRGRKGVVAAAAEMYRNSMNWRSTTKIEHGFMHGTRDDSLHKRFDDSWKVVGLLGRDRGGNPIIWERLGKTKMSACSETPVQFLVDHEVYTMARTQQAMDELIRLERKPYMYYTVVEDLEGLGIQHLNLSALQKYKACVRIDQDYYPEILSRILIVRAPWIFAQIWAIAKHFFDQGTRDKIQIVSAKDTKKVLSQFVESKWLPEEFGGTLKLGSNPEHYCCDPFIPTGKEVPPELVGDIRAAYS